MGGSLRYRIPAYLPTYIQRGDGGSGVWPTPRNGLLLVISREKTGYQNCRRDELVPFKPGEPRDARRTSFVERLGCLVWLLHGRATFRQTETFNSSGSRPRMLQASPRSNASRPLLPNVSSHSSVLDCTCPCGRRRNLGNRSREGTSELWIVLRRLLSRQPRILLPSFPSLLLITAEAVMAVFQIQIRNHEFDICLLLLVANRSRCTALQGDVTDVASAT